MAIIQTSFFVPSAQAQRSPKPNTLNATPDQDPIDDLLSPVTAMISGSSTQQTKLQTQNQIDAHQPKAERDADDKIIAAWFKLMKPHRNTDSTHAKHDRDENDPGRVPDPLYEPTKENVPTSLKIIAFNDLMRALAPKKPHWKHYDDVSNQYQVGSQERD